MLPEARYHDDIVRKEMRGMRELWIAWEVSWQVWKSVSALLRLSGDNGQKGEVLHHVGAWFEWWQVAQTCANTWERKRGGLEVQGDGRSRKDVSKLLVPSIFG